MESYISGCEDFRQSFLDVRDEFEVGNGVAGTDCPADPGLVHRVAVLNTELEHQTSHPGDTRQETLTSSSVVTSMLLPSVLLWFVNNWPDCTSTD